MIDALPIDGMGAPDEPGTLLVNCLAFPGIPVGCAKFQTPHIEETIILWGYGISWYPSTTSSFPPAPSTPDK